jgi:hypothetical protein
MSRSPPGHGHRRVTVTVPNAITRVQIPSKPANIGHIITFIAEHSDPERTTHMLTPRAPTLRT